MKPFCIFCEKSITLPEYSTKLSFDQAYPILKKHFTMLRVGGTSIRNIVYGGRDTRLSLSDVEDWLERYVNPSAKLVKYTQSYIFKMDRSQDFVQGTDYVSSLKQAIKTRTRLPKKTEQTIFREFKQQKFTNLNLLVIYLTKFGMNIPTVLAERIFRDKVDTYFCKIAKASGKRWLKGEKLFLAKIRGQQAGGWIPYEYIKIWLNGRWKELEQELGLYSLNNYVRALDLDISSLPDLAQKTIQAAIKELEEYLARGFSSSIQGGVDKLIVLTRKLNRRIYEFEPYIFRVGTEKQKKLYMKITGISFDTLGNDPNTHGPDVEILSTVF